MWPGTGAFRHRLFRRLHRVSYWPVSLYVVAPFDSPVRPIYYGAVDSRSPWRRARLSFLMQTVAIGADHGGFELKQQLAEHIRSRGFAVEDCGTHSTDAVDYPKIAAEVAQRVADGRAGVGVIIDGAGIGSSMTANKFPGVRAALCYDLSSARNSREHNNANVLTLGASLIGAGLAKQIVDTFLDTECTADRHLRRAAMIDEIDSQLRTRTHCQKNRPTAPGSAGGRRVKTIVNDGVST